MYNKKCHEESELPQEVFTNWDNWLRETGKYRETQVQKKDQGWIKHCIGYMLISVYDSRDPYPLQFDLRPGFLSQKEVLNYKNED